MAKRAYPTTKKCSSFVRPDGSYRPTWDYRGVEIDGLGKKGYLIGIRGRPECLTLGQARDRIDAYHRRRASQTRRRVLDLVGALARPVGAQPVEQPDYRDFIELVEQSTASAAEFLPTYEPLTCQDGLFVQGDRVVTPLDKAAVNAGVVAIVERDVEASEADGEEQDTWGVCLRVANDIAARYGCRVELSGCDDPHMPLTYDVDSRTYTVITECATGRLVGLVGCWQSEDGDLIVPRSWLTITLGAWTAEGTPKRVA